MQAPRASKLSTNDASGPVRASRDVGLGTGASMPVQGEALQPLQPRYSVEAPSGPNLAPLRVGPAANRRTSLNGPIAALEGKPKPAADGRAGGGTRSVHVRRKAATDTEGIDLGRASRTSGTGGNDSTSSRHRGVQFAGGHESSSSSTGGNSTRGGGSSRTAPLELPALGSGSAAAAAAGGGRAVGGTVTAGPAGVTLPFLTSLAATTRPGTTLRDLYRSTILTATRSARCAYVDLMRSEHRARPTHVLVCSWDECLADVVEQLADFAASLEVQSETQAQQAGAQSYTEQQERELQPQPPRSKAGHQQGSKAAPSPPAGGAPEKGRQGMRRAGGSGSGSGSGDGSAERLAFAVWLDLFAVNFHAAHTAAPHAAASGGAAGVAARIIAAAKPATPTLELLAQERARAAPPAIAAARSVLLLPGRQGAALREHPCTLAVWHALRQGGRANGGGVELEVAAPRELDVGLLQAAFEGLAVSTKATEDPAAAATSSAAAAGNGIASGAVAAGSTGSGASRMSPDRAAMRAIRDGAAANAAAATALVSDPQPALTVRAGLTAAVKAAAEALLARPVVAIHGGAGSGAGYRASSVPASPSLPVPTAQPRFGSVVGGGAAEALFTSPSPPQQPPPPLALSAASRRTMLPSPLRKGPSNGNLLLSPADAWAASNGSPTSSTTSAPAGASNGLGLTAAPRPSVSSAPGENAAACGDGASGGGGGAGAVGGGRMLHTISGSGSANSTGAAEGWAAAAPLWSSADGTAVEALCVRRPRGLAPLPDGPSSAEGSAAASPRARLRGRSQAPWELIPPLPNPAARAAAASLAGTSILAGALTPPFNRGGSTASSASTGTWTGVGGEDSAGAPPLLLPGQRSSPSSPAGPPPPSAGGGYLPQSPPLQATSVSASPSPSVSPSPSPPPALYAEARDAVAGAAHGGSTGTAPLRPPPRPARSHALPPRFSDNPDKHSGSLNAAAAAAAVAAASDSSSEAESDPDLMESKNSIQIQTRSGPSASGPSHTSLPETPIAGGSNRGGGSAGSGGAFGRAMPPAGSPHASLPHTPVRDPSVATSPAATAHGMGSSSGAGAAGSLVPRPPSSPPRSAGAAGGPAGTAVPCRPLAPGLARLIAAGRMLAALGESEDGLRLARHALAAARTTHGAAHPDTARCAVALGGLLHHCQAQQQLLQPSLAGKAMRGSTGGGVTAAAVAVAALRPGSRLGSPARLASPARLGSPAHLPSPLSSPPGAPAPSTPLPSGHVPHPVAARALASPLRGGAAAAGLPPAPPPTLSSAAAAAAPSSPASSDDAEGLLRNGLVVLERLLGAEHEEALAARQSLAAILAAAGRHDEAIPLLQRVLASPAAHRTPPCAASLTAGLELATCLAAVGRQREARKLLRTQLRTLQEEEDEAAAVAAAAALAAARSRAAPPALPSASPSATGAAQGLPPPGLPAAARSGLPRSGPGPCGSPRGSSGSLVALAAVAAAAGPGGLGSGSPSGAPSPSPGSPNTAAHASRGLSSLKRQDLQAKCAHLLARLKSEAGKTEAARALYRQAIECYTAVYGARHVVTAECTLGLAACLHAAHEYFDAQEQYRAVLQLYTELYGPHHPATKRVAARLDEVDEALEDA